jgi:AraC-like DNA-binding protein
VLLSDQRLQIKEIAQRLHFASDYYFSYFFRQKTGMSPTEFRKHLGSMESMR